MRLGRIAALALAEAGAHVAVADINERTGGRVAEEIRTLGRKAVFVKADVTKPDDIEGAVTATVAALGGLDIAVNNAWAGGRFAAPPPAEEFPLADWDFTMDLALRAVFVGCKAAARVMMAQGREGLWLWVNEGGGRFRMETLLEWPPTWGGADFRKLVPVLAALVPVAIVLLPHLEGAMRLWALVVTAFLSLMAWSALCTVHRGYYMRTVALRFAVAGYLMFLSDLAVGLSFFYPGLHRNLPWLGTWIWITYIPAWALIVVNLSEPRLRAEAEAQ